MSTSNNSHNDFFYLRNKDKFLGQAFLALKDQFHSYNEFLDFFDNINMDSIKNLFLKMSVDYLFCVKKGDWKVDIPGEKESFEIIANTYKYIAIFYLIESLSTEKFIDFYEYLVRKKSRILFPIETKNALEGHYEKYKNEFGSIKRVISFFRGLSIDRQNYFISKFEVMDAEPTIENFAKYLYEMRSKFIHEGKLVLHMSRMSSMGYLGNKFFICNLSMNEMMSFFEEGLLAYFRAQPYN